MLCTQRAKSGSDFTTCYAGYTNYYTTYPMPKIKPERAAVLLAGAREVPVLRSLLKALPDAQPFFTHLLSSQGVTEKTALIYVKLAARLARRGELYVPDKIRHTPERTAANAYHTWRGELYTKASNIIAAALAVDAEVVARLRVHSLSFPRAGKMLALPPNPITQQRSYELYEGLTLHIPKRDDTPVHDDPCLDECTIVKLTPAQTEALAVAVELVWGTRSVWTLRSSLKLIGEPPLSSYEDKAKNVAVVALSGFTNTSEALGRNKAYVTRSPDEFIAGVRDKPDAVYIARDVCTGRLDDVLDAIRSAWSL